jgi:2-amino-4-hydroxy-6-hydroxymethyldihydropteridine diphosphokinase
MRPCRFPAEKKRNERVSVLYYLGLGSNLGDRRQHIERAAAFLGTAGGDGLFLNMVLALETALTPQELLAECRKFEAAQGRVLENSHYRDRAIDIDILLAGDLVMDTPELTVPHPRLTERGFVLVPLFEIAPKLVHPLEKVTVTRLLSRLKGGEKIRKI